MEKVKVKVEVEVECQKILKKKTHEAIAIAAKKGWLKQAPEHVKRRNNLKDELN